MCDFVYVNVSMYVSDSTRSPLTLTRDAWMHATIARWQAGWGRIQEFVLGCESLEHTHIYVAMPTLTHYKYNTICMIC
jgi:hypothetical protein